MIRVKQIPYGMKTKGQVPCGTDKERKQIPSGSDKQKGEFLAGLTDNRAKTREKVYSAPQRLKTREPLVPPKPNELLSA